MILRELPGLTDEAAKIWADELHGLPLEAAQDILRFRGAIGRQPLAEPALPSVEPSRPVPPPLELSPLSPPLPIHQPLPEPQRMQATLDALRQAIAITLNNLANADTPGFQRVELVWFDGGYERLPAEPTGGAAVTVGTGARLATRLDVSAGPLVESARGWDWAIVGEGFFCVRDGEALRYTRCGRFSVQDGQVVLRVGSKICPLEPPVAWPSIHDVLVWPNGDIISTRANDDDAAVTVGQIVLTRFDAPEQLRPVGGLLLEATPNAGEPHTAHPGQSGCGSVRSRWLEGSNVDWDEEFARLTQLRHRLDTLAHLTGPVEHAPPPRPVATIPAVAEPSRVPPVSGTGGDIDPVDAWFKKYFQSEKARIIEENLGID
jgi:flagellar basal body rod protein FlgG